MVRTCARQPFLQSVKPHKLLLTFKFDEYQHRITDHLYFKQDLIKNVQSEIN